MTKKHGVSIDFDEKQFDKDFRKAFNKQLAKFDKKMKCPICEKKRTFKFRNYKAKCPSCSSEITLNRT
ncbi:hypothetical protein KJC28_01185 [Staphylococcus haemolyticus]|uniref:hypothetical protein n=1 Tax=Staphylococcus haemolyticus TaxID=1283 RepID=UPI001F3AA7A8|nr:hypothetical protein [Staphylococcus haemolyticus]MCE4953509.1 hypothetical protein [Staphylococcus haemolyticus]